MTDESTETRTARLKRERNFHDDVFADGHRRRSSRFYYMLESLKADKYERIEKLAPGAAILEYGCGPESESRAFWEIAANIELIDISPIAVEQVATAAADVANVNASVMDAEALEYSDESFDVIIGDGILHHLDLERSVHEIRRVLKPGGSALFIEPLAANPAVSAYRRLTPKERTIDEHPLTQRDLDMFSATFSTAQITYAGLTSLFSALTPTPRMRAKTATSLEKLDHWIVGKYPKAGIFSWACLLELTR